MAAPKCRWCEEELKPNIKYEEDVDGCIRTRYAEGDEIRGYGQNGEGMFCSFRCGFRYASRIVREGEK